MPSFMDMLHAAQEEARANKPERPKLAPDIEAIRLRDSYAQFNEQHVFRPGMIVRQKPQAGCYKGFGDNNLTIVIEMLAEPIIAGPDKQGTPYYLERQDMIVGSIENNSFCIWHVDSRCFEPVPEEN